MKRMKSVERSQGFLRKRKMLLVLPLLVVPFLTMAFWAMGGGKGGNTSGPSVTTQGLNLNLPKANLKEDKHADKLSFYDKADKDSAKLAEWMRNDPYYKKDNPDISVSNELESITETTATRHNQPLNPSPYETSSDNPEQKIMQRLALLEKEMKKAEVSGHEDSLPDYAIQGNDAFSQEVDKLENMMQVMNKGNENDPEMKQLENTLDKILDIQHPDRVKERIKEKSVQNKQQVFAVSRTEKLTSVSLLGDNYKLDTPRKQSTAHAIGFYGTEDNVTEDQANAIEAVIHESQTLVSGSVVKLRLLNDVYINGSLIPKDNFLFGMASLNGERLEIEINSIRYQQAIYPVNLQMYDLDGLPGIYIPGAITRDVAKQSADNSLQLMELNTMDPTLKAQATAAGIGAAKNLLSKKVKLIKVMVKAGYKVLLKDGNQQQ